MKRYRLLSTQYDTRPFLLKMAMESSDPKPMWLEAVEKQTIQELVARYGAYSIGSKVENFVAIGNLPWSIVSFHNDFLEQASDSGLSAGSLTERSRERLRTRARALPATRRPHIQG